MTTILAVSSAQKYPRTVDLEIPEGFAVARLLADAKRPASSLGWTAVVREALDYRVGRGCYAWNDSGSELTVSTEMAWLVLAHACEQALPAGDIRTAILAKLDVKGKRVAEVIKEARTIARSTEKGA